MKLKNDQYFLLSTISLIASIIAIVLASVAASLFPLDRGLLFFVSISIVVCALLVFIKSKESELEQNKSGEL